MIRRKACQSPGLRLAAALCIAATLSGCQTAASGAPLSPSQQRLRGETERFNETVATGAVAGALLGALVGALACGRDNRAACAAGGGVAGAALGAGAGYYVATQNESYATREQGVAARRTAAAKEAASFRQIADASEAVVREHRASIATMKEQLRRGQLTAEQARQRTAAMREDANLMRKAIDNNDKVRAALEQDIARLRQARNDTAALEQSRRQIADANRRIQGQLDDLNSALAGLPTG